LITKRLFTVARSKEQTVTREQLVITNGCARRRTGWHLLSTTRVSGSGVDGFAAMVFAMNKIA
jgi:hypothetical protein